MIEKLDMEFTQEKQDLDINGNILAMNLIQEEILSLSKEPVDISS